MATGVRVQGDGGGQPVLVLLHGLGATGDVWHGWRPLLAERWPGRWVAPDLPGHGGSDPLTDYTFQNLATAVAQVLDPADRHVILGHSLGGVVGLALAGAGSGRQVDAVIGLGIKVAWTDDELARARSLAGRPVTWFGSRAEAAARYLRVSGLDGLLDPDDPAVDRGLRAEAGRWRLALDPAAFAVGAPDLPGLLAAAPVPVMLARGDRDPMVSHEQLADLVPDSVSLPGLGHNAHVQQPAAVFQLLERHPSSGDHRRSSGDRRSTR